MEELDSKWRIEFEKVAEGSKWFAQVSKEVYEVFKILKYGLQSHMPKGDLISFSDSYLANFF